MNWEWIAKITNPVTLTAFSLALVFGALSRVKRYRWWPPAAMGLAKITVLGGLVLAYADTTWHEDKPAIAATSSPPNESRTAPAQVHSQVVSASQAARKEIKTYGSGSHVFSRNNVRNGNFNVNINESVH